jgi:hypothetical protein
MGRQCNSGVKKLYEENEALKKQLKIAVEALLWYSLGKNYQFVDNLDNDFYDNWCRCVLEGGDYVVIEEGDMADKALEQIEELDK